LKHPHDKNFILSCKNIIEDEAKYFQNKQSDLFKGLQNQIEEKKDEDEDEEQPLVDPFDFFEGLEEVCADLKL
jgi:hypothetical protein